MPGVIESSSPPQVPDEPASPSQEPNAAGPPPQEPGQSSSSSEDNPDKEWHRIVNLPDNISNLGGDDWRNTKRNLYYSGTWRIHPYEEYESKEDKKKNLSHLKFINKDQRAYKEANGNWPEDLEAFITMVEKWVRKEEPGRNRDISSNKDAEYLEEDISRQTFLQSLKIQKAFLENPSPFQQNRIRKVHFLFPDSIHRPLLASENDIVGADVHEKDIPKFHCDRNFYELCAFRTILKSVLRGWQPCNAEGCKGEGSCQKLQVFFNEPRYNIEQDNTFIKGAFWDYEETGKVELRVDAPTPAKLCSSLDEIYEGQSKLDKCRQNDALVVSFRPTNPTRQLLADLDRDIQKRKKIDKNIRNSVLAVVCPPVWYRKEAPDLKPVGDFKPFNTLYDIVTNRVVDYFDNFDETPIIPAGDFFPNHGLIRPFSIYRLKGPDGLPQVISNPTASKQYTSAGPSTC